VEPVKSIFRSSQSNGERDQLIACREIPSKFFSIVTLILVQNFTRIILSSLVKTLATFYIIKNINSTSLLSQEFH